MGKCTLPSAQLYSQQVLFYGEKIVTKLLTTRSFLEIFSATETEQLSSKKSIQENCTTGQIKTYVIIR